MTNLLCRRLGVEIPILQAPTASIAGPELAAAVSIAGGLGGMGVTWSTPQEAAAAVREVRRQTDRPFQVNFALAFEPVSLDAVLEAGPPVVSFSWGDAGPLVRRVKEAGAYVGVQVGNIEGAQRILDAGVDYLVCQGVEAGGHVQSTTPRDILLEQVLAIAGTVPVVAAGGIADERDVATAMANGAHGVMLGTRFVATLESRAHPDYKRRLVAAQSGMTSLTVCFDGGWPHAPHRVLRNSTLEEWEAAGCLPPGRRPDEGDVVGVSQGGDPILRYEDTAPRTGMSGNIEAMALYAGKGVGRVQDLPPAGEVVQRLWAGAQALLNSSSIGTNRS
jgi:nitronate monooxygenase